MELLLVTRNSRDVVLALVAGGMTGLLEYFPSFPPYPMYPILFAVAMLFGVFKSFHRRQEREKTLNASMWLQIPVLLLVGVSFGSGLAEVLARVTSEGRFPVLAEQLRMQCVESFAGRDSLAPSGKLPSAGFCYEFLARSDSCEKLTIRFAGSHFGIRHFVWSMNTLMLGGQEELVLVRPLRSAEMFHGFRHQRFD